MQLQYFNNDLHESFLVGDKIRDLGGKEYYLGPYCKATGLVTLVRIEDGQTILMHSKGLLHHDEKRMIIQLGDNFTKLPSMFCPFDPMVKFTMPVRGTKGSIGYDLYVAKETVLPTSKLNGIVEVNPDSPLGRCYVDDYSYACYKAQAISTNTRCNFPAGWGGLVKERSSIGKRGLMCLAGVIDNDYQGEITIMMVNLGPEVVFKAGERIAQLVLIPYYSEGNVDLLSTGDRGAGGFGSTGA